jgi:hypothetical protein
VTTSADHSTDHKPLTTSTDSQERRRSMFPHPRYRFLDDRGMTTTEYAVGIIAAAAFAGLLFVVVQEGSVQEGLAELVERALDFRG